MKDRGLTSILVVLAVFLGTALFMSERKVSRMMETVGGWISDALGF